MGDSTTADCNSLENEQRHDRMMNTHHKRPGHKDTCLSQCAHEVAAVLDVGVNIVNVVELHAP
jgi:hypothetical protein